MPSRTSRYSRSTRRNSSIGVPPLVHSAAKPEKLANRAFVFEKAFRAALCSALQSIACFVGASLDQLPLPCVELRFAYLFGADLRILVFRRLQQGIDVHPAQQETGHSTGPRFVVRLGLGSTQFCARALNVADAGACQEHPDRRVGIAWSQLQGCSQIFRGLRKVAPQESRLATILERLCSLRIEPDRLAVIGNRAIKFAFRFPRVSPAV